MPDAPPRRRHPRPLAGRRPLLAAPLLALPPLLLPAAAPRAARLAPLRFRILREGTAIGTHRLAFAEAADATLTAETEVDIAVRLAGITVFRFSHRFREVWSEGRLRSATSRKDRNGTVTQMTARAEGGAILVEGPEGAQRHPAEAAPLSWWDVTRIEAQRPLFANDTGKALRLAWTRTPLPGGGRRWRCTGDAEGEGTWAADGTWLAWTTKGDDGSVVTYERA
jgi:hypothetical protein